MRGKNIYMALAALAALSFGAPVQTGGFAEKAVLRAEQPRGTTLRDILSGAPSYRKTGRRSGYGWTNAHAQRVALKKRRVQRHRASARGRRA